MIWKKWYSLIRGIEKGWIVPGNDADDTLKDLIINLEAEAGQSIKGFQSEILDLEDPNMVLDELEAAARKILKEYSAAQDALTAFTPEVIADRVAKAEYELTFAPRFDKVLVNDDLQKALDEGYRMVSDFLNA